MHPFDSRLDTSFHDVAKKKKQLKRRRFSLDNSCLLCKESLLRLKNDAEEFDFLPRRRLSFDRKFVVTTTFLAGDRQHRHNKVELDLDWHDSDHCATSRNNTREREQEMLLTTSKETCRTVTMTDEDFGGDHDNDFDSFYEGSECESFSLCDTAVQET